MTKLRCFKVGANSNSKIVIIDLSIIHFKCVMDNYGFKQRHIYDKSIGLSVYLNINYKRGYFYCSWLTYSRRNQWQHLGDNWFWQKGCNYGFVHNLQMVIFGRYKIPNMIFWGLSFKFGYNLMIDIQRQVWIAF